MLGSCLFKKKIKKMMDLVPCQKQLECDQHILSKI